MKTKWMVTFSIVLVMITVTAQAAVVWCNGTATELISGTKPVGTVSLSEVGGKLTVRANLAPGEFVSDVLVFRPWTPLSPFGKEGSFTDPTLSWGVNHAPNGYTFPLKISFSTSNRDGGVELFDGQDSHIWSVQYLVLLGAKAPGPDEEINPGGWDFVAHIQGIGQNGNSGWIGAPITVVPEPGFYGILTGLGLLSFAGWRKFRK